MCLYSSLGLTSTHVSVLKYVYTGGPEYLGTCAYIRVRLVSVMAYMLSTYLLVIKTHSLVHTLSGAVAQDGRIEAGDMLLEVRNAQNIKQLKAHVDNVVIPYVTL